MANTFFICMTLALATLISATSPEQNAYEKCHGNAIGSAAFEEREKECLKLVPKDWAEQQQVVYVNEKTGRLAIDSREYADIKNKIAADLKYNYEELTNTLELEVNPQFKPYTDYVTIYGESLDKNLDGFKKIKPSPGPFTITDEDVTECTKKGFKSCQFYAQKNPFGNEFYIKKYAKPLFYCHAAQQKCEKATIAAEATTTGKQLSNERMKEINAICKNKWQCRIETSTKITSTPVPSLLKKFTITPDKGPAGTVFTFEAETTKGNNGEKVKQVILQNAKTKKVLFDLEDEGKNGDKKAVDGIFSAAWNSLPSFPDESALPKTFVFDLVLKIDGKPDEVIQNAGKLEVEKAKCEEVIKGHNNPKENRINIVFLGIKWGALNEFKEMVSLAIGAKQGILSHEPFKSNAKKFNFWTVTRLEGTKASGEAITSDRELKKEIKKLSDTCKLKKTYNIAIIKEGFRSEASSKDLHALIAYEENIIREDDTTVSPESRTAVTTVHELGHLFANLEDEYEEKPDAVGKFFILFPPFSKLISLLDTVKRKYGEKSQSQLIKVDSLDQCFSLKYNQAYFDLIGNGCGKEGVIDCNRGDLDSKEISCYEGGGKTHSGLGYNFKLFRPTLNSVMNFQYYKLGSSFNLVQQRIVCREIKEQTGSATGVCDKLCLEGCGYGLKCVQGECQPGPCDSKGECAKGLSCTDNKCVVPAEQEDAPNAG